MSRYIAYILFLSLLIFSSCAKKKGIEGAEKLTSKSLKFLQMEIEENRLDFETFNARFSAKTDINNEKLSFKGTLKIKRDSIIWLSLTKLGGVEMIRLILTQDSIKFINKWDKEYYLGTIDKINRLENVTLSYFQIQDLLLGELIEYDPEEKFNTSHDNSSYLLTSRNKSNIRKASTIIEGDSIMEIDFEDKKLQKALAKNSESDFIIKNYYLLPDSYWLARQTINIVDVQQALDIIYNDYMIVEEKFPFAMNQFIRIASENKSSRIELAYSEIQFNRDDSYPFKISSKYEPIKKRN